MAQSKQCNDPQCNGPHTWYEPTNVQGKTVQVEYSCPGKKKR
jgi:hypothetical protein